jgi:hypothetical protein
MTMSSAGVAINVLPAKAGIQLAAFSQALKAES